MRKILSPLFLLLGLALLVLGIGQQTWWAPPSNVEISSAKIHDGAPLTVVEPNIEHLSENETELRITGDGEFKIALGRTVDVDAWVGDAAHQKLSSVVTTEDDEAYIELEEVEGETDIPNPANSDMWVEVQDADQSMTYRFQHPQEGSWSLLLFVDGEAAAPTQFSIDWEYEPDFSSAVAMSAVGIIFILLGIAVLFGAKPKRNPRRRATKATAVVLISGLAATGLSLSQPSAVHATETQTETDPAHAVLVTQQAERIIHDVAAKVTQADENQEITDAAKTRIDGLALDMRQDNYNARERAEELLALQEIGTSILSVMATSNDDFPRYSVMITEAEDENLPQVLTLRQNTARENYKLLGATPLVPGVELDALDLSVGGLTPVTATEDSLSYQPEQFFKDLAANLSDENNAEELSAVLEDNPYIQLIREDQETQTENNPDADVSFGRTLVEDSIHGMTLPDGSAMMIGTLRQTTRIQPEEDATLELEELTAKLLGEETIETELIVQKSEQYTVIIPAEGADGDVEVIGVSEVTRNASTSDE